MLRPPVCRECLFEVNLATAAGKTRHSFCVDGFEDAITAPARPQFFRSSENIVFVIGMPSVRGRAGYAQARQLPKTVAQPLCMFAPDAQPVADLAEHHPPDSRLHFSHSPISTKRFMQPPVSRNMLLPVHGVI